MITIEQRISVRKESDLDLEKGLLTDALIAMQALRTSQGHDIKSVFTHAPGIAIIDDAASNGVKTKFDHQIGSHDILPAPVRGEIYFGDRSSVSFKIEPRDQQSIHAVVDTALSNCLQDGLSPTPGTAPALKMGKLR